MVEAQSAVPTSDITDQLVPDAPAPDPALTLDQQYSNLAAKLGHLTVISDDLPKEIMDTKKQMREIKLQAIKEAQAKNPSSPKTP